MGLFKPIWMTEKYNYEEKWAIAAVRRIKNEDKLYEIAVSAPHDTVRIAAVEGIRNEQLLRKIAEASDYVYSDVGTAAIERIRDDHVLREIAMSSSVERDIIKLDALAKIKDQTILADIAFHAPHDTALQAAGRIVDPDLKLKLAMSDADSASQCVFFAVSDPDQLRKIALGSLSKEARLAAVRKIRDVDTHLDVLTQEKVLAIRKQAYAKLQLDCISFKKMVPTDEQCKRLADLLIDEPVGTDVFIYRDTFAGHPDVLERIFREAKRNDIRAQAFAGICYEAPFEQLPELYNEAEIYDAKESILNRLSEKENNDPALLMAFIKDFEAEYEKDSVCTGLLFKPQLNDAEGIEKMRDEAVAAFLERIPVYEEKSGGKTDKKVCLRELIKYLTPEQEKKYGIEVSGYEHENEDEFGRYTSRTTVIKFEGKSYY